LHRCFVLADHDHLARAVPAIHDELPDESATVFRYPDRSRVMHEVIDTLERDIEDVVVLVVRDADDPGAIYGGSGADERARQHDRRDFGSLVAQVSLGERVEVFGPAFPRNQLAV